MAQSFTLAELAERLGGVVIGDGDTTVEGICALDEPRPECLAFASSRTPRALEKALAGSSAKAVLVRHGIELPPGVEFNGIAVPDPQRAMMVLVPLFFARPAEERGVSPRAEIHSTARIGKDVSIGPFAAIGASAVVEDEAVIHPHVTIYRGAEIGRGAILHAGAVVREECRVAAYAVVQNGAIIGADGFGYVPNRDGSLEPVPQVGNVVLEERVEVGANTCIDRAALGTTRIGAGTKIDNQVQIGHNVKIGRHSILCGQVGIAGSSALGDHVVLGARTGVADHVHVCSKCRFAAGTDIYVDVPEPGDYAGSPAMPATTFKRNFHVLRNIAATMQQLKASLKKLHEKNA